MCFAVVADQRVANVSCRCCRWHPDKNPILTEFATEVSKILNAAVAKMEESIVQEANAQGKGEEERERRKGRGEAGE